MTLKLALEEKFRFGSLAFCISSIRLRRVSRLKPWGSIPPLTARWQFESVSRLSSRGLTTGSIFIFPINWEGVKKWRESSIFWKRAIGNWNVQIDCHCENLKGLKQSFLIYAGLRSLFRTCLRLLRRTRKRVLLAMTENRKLPACFGRELSTFVAVGNFSVKITV